MFSRERINKKLEVLNEHFDFKDFIGLSALIFGLLLSNTSLRKTTAQAAPLIAPPPITVQEIIEKPLNHDQTIEQIVKKPAKQQAPKKVSKKKKAKKKVLKSKDQPRKTAARGPN